MNDNNKLLTTKSNIYALICAILNSAVSDIKLQHGVDEAIYFINSDWCRELCGDIEVSYQAYKEHCLKLYRKTKRGKKKNKAG